MGDTSWKQVERRAARFFGAERQIGSGSLGRQDRSGSDSTHPRLFIEAKRRKGFLGAIRAFSGVSQKALSEGKLPLLWIQYGGDAILVLKAKNLVEIAGCCYAE